MRYKFRIWSTFDLFPERAMEINGSDANHCSYIYYVQAVDIYNVFLIVAFMP